MSRIFIERPIFAWVLAIITMLAGIGAIYLLPIEQYPDVAPPQVNIRATFPGASADTLENSVTQIIEQQLTGIDGLLFFSSSSSSRGQVTISATFEKGIDPDIAQVQVQNQVQQALVRLPQQVQQQGLRVTKSNPDFLMIVGVYDETDRSTNIDVSDFLVTNLQDTLARIEGVGETNVFGSQYAMRIWLDPDRLASVGLMPGDVVTAIRNQNTEVAAGEVGGLPQPETNQLNATVTSQSRMRTVEEFEAIILKSEQSGALVRLADVARVELGAENYSASSRINGHPGAGLAVSSAPGADALATADLVKEAVARAQSTFPPGYKVAYANDTTAFIRLSIREVIGTLIEAIILVVIVMFVFLHSWRATLIPTIAVPVTLLGTFVVFFIFDFSINTLTLFGLVLAIGILVDDAIVVVENVERLMEENPDMTPKEATIQSMGEIQVALVAIAIVLSAVFLPMAFFGGSTGVIYRQFSVTMISAMILSTLVALILSPALTTSLLRQKHKGHDQPQGWLDRRFPAFTDRLDRAQRWFNNGFARGTDRYVGAIEKMVDRKWLFLAIYAIVLVLLAVLFVRLPTSFLPTEDQGAARVQFRLPAGATQGRTREVQLAIEKYMLEQERDNIAVMFSVAGGGQGAAGQNTGQGFVNFVDWSERKGAENSADGIVERAGKAFSQFRDAQVNALVPAAIRGLGQTNGFSLQLQNTSGMSREEFADARDKLLALAEEDTLLTGVRLGELPDVATLQVEIDQPKLAALGLNQQDVNTTLSAAWGGQYVNDFIDRGRVKRVFVQGDAPYRATPDDLAAWFVRGSGGQMAPFSAFSRSSWSTTPTTLSRFQGYPSFQFEGQAVPGQSSGAAMDRIEELAGQIPGVSVAWSGLSFQERLSSGQAPLLYGLSLLVVFLCLAALYESWSVPVAVMLIIPLGLVGAIFAVTLRGLENDVYLQIGLLTTMGLSAKNAILVIEFAERAERQGARVIDAALQAARLRLRPILMTSLAFIFGVLPLALSSGAGANSRIAIGTSVIGGMLTATVLAIFFIPLFFVLVRRTTRDTLKKLHTSEAKPTEGAA
ncbi:multidrug efflux RND transporter permease subunit [Blastomonas aquatica]|uniref:Efflux pump membrane transporter n=1 Tax=Blastomonas aquatica TaxID=1510276 RepID=A0ABQ1J3E2_9SPHN|nr:multidrug efflux RND transporter permease subunit [Blastomonas aquatica]GGB58606.1 multidrug efflux RND transporter permease subunit [Blastomonas aquatica]